MINIERFYRDYAKIHSLKLRRGEVTNNDTLFGYMALIYALSIYSKKYGLLKEKHYADLFNTYYGGPIKTNSRVKQLHDKFLSQLLCFSTPYENYVNDRESAIEMIMDLEPDLDREKATEVFDLYYALFLGGLLYVGDEKISDKAISNLFLFRLTNNNKPGFSYDANEYASYIMPRYFELAIDRFNKVREGKGDNVFYKYVASHRDHIGRCDFFIDKPDINSSIFEQVFRGYDCLELNINKKLLGKKIRQADLFANPDYYFFKKAFPEFNASIHNRNSKREQINEYLFDFLNEKITSKYKIDGAYTFKLSDTDYKLFIVIRDRNTFNEIMGNLRTIMPIDEFNNISFTITPIFVPNKDNDDLYFEIFKETLINNDSILYDRKRFLKKSFGKFMAKSNGKDKPKQYIISNK